MLIGYDYFGFKYVPLKKAMIQNLAKGQLRRECEYLYLDIDIEHFLSYIYIYIKHWLYN